MTKCGFVVTDDRRERCYEHQRAVHVFRPHSWPRRSGRQRHGHSDWQAPALHRCGWRTARGPAADVPRCRHQQRDLSVRPALCRPAAASALDRRAVLRCRRVRGGGSRSSRIDAAEAPRCCACAGTRSSVRQQSPGVSGSAGPASTACLASRQATGVGMPIRREMHGFYPSDWPQISRKVRFERAAGICQSCGRPHGMTVRCLPDGPLV